MNLHHDTQLFSQTLRAASQHLEINLGFVEKDYWITLVLRRLSGSKYSDEAVFKGGTSLSKDTGSLTASRKMSTSQLSTQHIRLAMKSKRSFVISKRR